MKHLKSFTLACNLADIAPLKQSISVHLDRYNVPNFLHILQFILYESAILPFTFLSLSSGYYKPKRHKNSGNKFSSFPDFARKRVNTVNVYFVPFQCISDRLNNGNI